MTMICSISFEKSGPAKNAGPGTDKNVCPPKKQNRRTGIPACHALEERDALLMRLLEQNNIA